MIFCELTKVWRLMPVLMKRCYGTPSYSRGPTPLEGSRKRAKAGLSTRGTKSMGAKRIRSSCSVFNIFILVWRPMPVLIQCCVVPPVAQLPAS